MTIEETVTAEKQNKAPKRQEKQTWIDYVIDRMNEKELGISFDEGTQGIWTDDVDLVFGYSYFIHRGEKHYFCEGEYVANAFLEVEEHFDIEQIFCGDSSLLTAGNLILRKEYEVLRLVEDGKTAFEFLCCCKGETCCPDDDDHIDIVTWNHTNDIKDSLHKTLPEEKIMGLIDYLAQIPLTVLSNETDSVPEGSIEHSEKFFENRKEYSHTDFDLLKQALFAEVKKTEDQRINAILTSVHNLERRVADHPIVLKSEHNYLQELYIKAINNDVNNLKVFEYKGKRIPYVLVGSFDIEGNAGKPSDNLYFVARDKAPEEWQQQIVAVHESLCVKKSHQYAKAEELEVAKLLGKENEYRAWRKVLDSTDR